MTSSREVEGDAPPRSIVHEDAGLKDDGSMRSEGVHMLAVVVIAGVKDGLDACWTGEVYEVVFRFLFARRASRRGFAVGLFAHAVDEAGRPVR